MSKKNLYIIVLFIAGMSILRIMAYVSFRAPKLRDISWRPYLEFQYFAERTHKTGSGATLPRTVYLFGGSAAYGWGCKDEETISAYMSERYKVVNKGTPAYNSTQELIKLIFVLRDQTHPDIVIFYDGFNDIWLSCTNGKADMPIRFWKSEREFMLLRKTIFHYLYYRYKPYKIELTDDLGQEATRAYNRNIAFAREICESFGVEFIYLKQPYCNGLLPKSVKEFIEKWYQPDITLDDSMYIDVCHLKPLGNRKVAEFLTRRIEENYKLAD